MKKTAELAALSTFLIGIQLITITVTVVLTSAVLVDDAVARLFR